MAVNYMSETELANMSHQIHNSKTKADVLSQKEGFYKCSSINDVNLDV